MSRSPKFYLDLARSPTVTAEELRTLAESIYPFVVCAVAQNPRTPGDVLALIARSGDTARSEIAANSATPVEVLESLADDLRWDSVAIGLANNVASSEAILREVGRYVVARSTGGRDNRNFEAGIALFRRPDTPYDLLIAMLNSDNATTQFRKVAARETCHLSVLDQLCNDRSEVVRRAAHRRS